MPPLVPLKSQDPLDLLATTPPPSRAVIEAPSFDPVPHGPIPTPIPGGGPTVLPAPPRASQPVRHGLARLGRALSLRRRFLLTLALPFAALMAVLAWQFTPPPRALPGLVRCRLPLPPPEVEALAERVRTPEFVREVLDRPGVRDLSVVHQQADAAQWLAGQFRAEPAEDGGVYLILNGSTEAHVALLRTAAEIVLPSAASPPAVGRKPPEWDAVMQELARLREQVRVAPVAVATTPRTDQVQGLIDLAVARRELEQVRGEIREQAATPKPIPAAPAPPPAPSLPKEEAEPLRARLQKLEKEIEHMRNIARPEVAEAQLRRSGKLTEVQELRRRLEMPAAPKVAAPTPTPVPTPAPSPRLEALRTRERSLAEQVARLETQNPEPATPAPVASPSPELLTAIAALEERVRRMEEPAAPVTVAVTTRGVAVEAREAMAAGLDRRPFHAGLAGGTTFLCLLCGAGAGELRRRRVYGVDDIARMAELPLLGVVPDLNEVAGLKPGQQPNPAQLRPLNESADVLRTLLLQMGTRIPLRVVMVTSARTGEGKTSLARLLATSLARSWRKTLLIDADLRRPSAHKLFDLSLEPGFCEVLRGESELTDVIKPTPVSRLWLMPAGNNDDYSLQALAQEGVRALFDRLGQEYEHIILDSGPVLPVADAVLLARHVDGAILSVVCGTSALPAVQAANHRLNSVCAPVLGAVVQGAPAAVYGPQTEAA